MYLAEMPLVRQPDVRLGVNAPVTRQRFGRNADGTLEMATAVCEILEQEADGIRPGSLAERDQRVRPAGRLDGRIVQVGDNLRWCVCHLAHVLVFSHIEFAPILVDEPWASGGLVQALSRETLTD